MSGNETKTIETSRSIKDKSVKFDKVGEKNRFFYSKNLLIEPASKENEMSGTYLSNNSVTLPMTSTYKRYKYMRKVKTNGILNLNIETKKGSDYNLTNERDSERRVSSDEQKNGKITEILKDVQNFRKNALIEAPEVKFKKEQKSTISSENMSLKKSY